MHEQNKIDEAQYFLDRMGVTEGALKELTYNLSAFLSASRSVLQYALRGARTTPGGEAWYRSQLSQWPIVALLKERRDVSIHSQPVRPAQRLIIRSRRNHSIGSAASGPAIPASVKVYLAFDGDRSGEELLATCKSYLEAIKAIVTDGRERGILSG